jgi:hypothetical protein
MIAELKLLRPLLLALLVAPFLARGQTLVADRPTLNGILAGSAFTETFQGFTLFPGIGQVFTGVNTVDSTSIMNSEGPGLVAPGLTFSGTSVQWDAAGYYNAPSTELLFNSSTITIDFSSPTIAFGLDVRDFSGFSATMVVTVYGADGTTVLGTYSGISIGDPSIFFGFQDAAGIGKVTLTNNANSWSPIIDNLTFEPVPEPSPFALIGCALAVALAVSAFRRHF